MTISAATATQVICKLRIAREHCERAMALVSGEAAPHLESALRRFDSLIKDATRVRDALILAGPIASADCVPTAVANSLAIPGAIALPMIGSRRLAAG